MESFTSERVRLQLEIARSDNAHSFTADFVLIKTSFQVDQFSMHLEQHAVNWPGWKHVADPVKIQLSNISPCDR